MTSEEFLDFLSREVKGFSPEFTKDYLLNLLSLAKERKCSLESFSQEELLALRARTSMSQWDISKLHF